MKKKWSHIGYILRRDPHTNTKSSLACLREEQIGKAGHRETQIRAEKVQKDMRLQDWMTAKTNVDVSVHHPMSFPETEKN